MVHGPVPGGGSAGLAELIDKHGEAIEADLQRFYGVDLLDVFRGKVQPRKVFRLLNVMPDTSALSARMRADPTMKATGAPEPWRAMYGWGQDRAMLADLWDVMAATIPQKGKKKPPTYPRPGSKTTSAGTPLSALMPKTRR